MDYQNLNQELDQLSLLLDGEFDKKKPDELIKVIDNHFEIYRINNYNKDKSTIRFLRKRIKELKDKYELLLQADSKKKLFDDFQANDSKTAEDMMKYGLQVQQDSTDSLKRTMGLIVASKQTGAQTAATLQKQTDQIINIDNGVENTGESLNRATRIIKRIGRKIATDKVIWVIAGLIVIAIVLIILFKLKVIKIN